MDAFSLIEFIIKLNEERHKNKEPSTAQISGANSKKGVMSIILN